MQKLKIVGLVGTIIKNPFFVGSMVMVIGINFYNFGQTVFHLLVGRLLGRVGYADFAAILSSLAIISIVEQALDLTVVKFVSSGRNKSVIVNFTRWVFYWSLWLGILAGIVFFIFSPFLIDFLRITQPSAVFVLSPIILFLFLLNIARAIFRGLLRFSSYVINLIVEVVIKLLLVYAFIIIGWGVFGAMVAVGIAVLSVIVLAYFPLSGYLTGKRYKTPDIFPLLKYSIPVFFLSLALTSMYSTDIILVKHFFLSEDAGLYAALSKLGSVAFFAAGPVAGVMFPYVSRSHSRGKPYRRFFFLSVILVLGISSLVVAVYKLAPSLVISLLYGPEFTGGAEILWWFGVYMALVGLVMLIMQFYLSIGRTKIAYPFVGAALLQIILIWFIHPSLIRVIQLSILSVTLLLGVLLVYLPYQKK